MLVYGDAERVTGADEACGAVERALAAVATMPPGLDRHAALVTAFIAAGELVQGVADAEFAARGCDAVSPAQVAGLNALLHLARAVDRSWTGAFTAPEALPEAIATGLRACRVPGPIRLRQGEGYAFYALYPESYAEAARRSGLPANTRVIGLRSIGTGLAALVAAALGTPPPVTLRPTGHPFRREIRIDRELAGRLLSHEAAFAIVDEGPGLSGSSFGAVMDWLEANGVARERIDAFPSHGDDLGPEASAAHRARWREVRRHHVSLDDLLLRPACAPHRLETWIASRIGPLDCALADLSGGTWRRGRPDWPAANLQQERRKFLARAGGRTVLVKHAGLGGEARRKVNLGRRLSEAGFAPPVLGECHGFLLESWIGEARPLDLSRVDRRALVERIGAYLGFRARAFPAPGARGAPLPDLARMALRNAGLALGEDRAAALGFRMRQAARLEERVHRIVTDNRLHRHEWLQGPDGRILKTDALDHAAAHDLVGCQDVTWDVAGAIVEFGLSQADAGILCGVVSREGGRPVDPALLAFMLPCYLAFHLGAATLAAQAIGGEEADRLRQEAERYGRALAGLLRDSSKPPAFDAG